jgi:hypothetical protein
MDVDPPMDVELLATLEEQAALVIASAAAVIARSFRWEVMPLRNYHACSFACKSGWLSWFTELHGSRCVCM